jgi:transposase
VQNRTDYKNRVHKVLQRCNIRLGSKLKVFGKAGMTLLEGLMAGRDLDEVVKESGGRTLTERRGELESVVREGLDEEDVFILRRCLGMMESLDEEIRRVDERIAMHMKAREMDARRISRVPGVAQVSASAILAELGDPRRFSDGKKAASWAGLCPSVYQSGGRNLTGRIKQGSRGLRRLMVQVAHVAARTRDSGLRLFYLRVAARRGKKKAIVALARKILCIIHHILVMGEEYVEEGFVKYPRLRFRAVEHMPLEVMAETLRCSGYSVHAPG